MTAIKPGETVFITSEQGTVSGYVLASRREYDDTIDLHSNLDPSGPIETTLTIKLQEKP